MFFVHWLLQSWFEMNEIIKGVPIRTFSYSLNFNLFIALFLQYIFGDTVRL